MSGSRFSAFDGITFTSLSPYVSSMTVASDGSFGGTETLSGSTAEVTGKLFSDGTATGTVKVSVDLCRGGPTDWSAARG
jgi:hypothetical protein